MSLIKTPSQIQVMREGGKILAVALDRINDFIKPGIDVWTLEEFFIDYCSQNNVIPACKNYTYGGLMPPFPTGLCVYINNQGVHCFPKKGTILKDNDVITVDTVIEYKGMHIDASFAKAVGNASLKNIKLINTAKNALMLSEDVVKDGVKVGMISNTMYKYVTSQGFNVLIDYAGHGIGESMHEAPEIPCKGLPTDGITLKSGMTICIEALVCAGSPEIESLTGWETQMVDGNNYVQFEHTVLVTSSGIDNLTPFKV